jgi:hypothetical protein
LNTRNKKWREPKSQSFSSVLNSISQTKCDDPSSEQCDENELAVQTWIQ